MPEELRDLGQIGLAAGIVGIVAGILAGVLLMRLRSKQRLVHPQFGKWVATWSPVEVIAILLLYFLVPVVVLSTLKALGFPDWGTSSGVAADSDVGKSVLNLWAKVLSFPLFVLGSFWILHSVSATSPRQFGLRVGRLDADFVAGYRAWLIGTPIVFLVLAGTLAGWMALTGKEPDQHPLVELWASLGPPEWVVFWFQIAVVAPFEEEFLCHGLLLVLVSRSLMGSRLLVAISAILALGEASQGDSPQLLTMTAFVLVIVIGYLIWCRDENSPRHAIVATAFLFAAAHANMWPTPVPLFVLGCFTGWVAWRCRSIVPAVVMHGLFNSVTGVHLILGGG